MGLSLGITGLKGTGPWAKAAHGQQCQFLCSHGLEHHLVSETVADLSVSAVSSFSWG